MTNNDHSRRTYLSILGGTGTIALAGCIASGQNNGPDFGDCVPPGQYECPDGELVGIFNFDGCEPVLEGDNECDISITVTESDEEDGECEAFSFTYDVGNPDCSIENIRVYGGSDCQDFDPTDGEIQTDLEAGQSDQQGAISNIRFCATLDENGNGENGNGENGNGENGDGENGDGENGNGENGDGENGDGENGDGEEEEDQEEEDPEELEEDDEKKDKPDVQDDVDLKLVSKKDGDKYEFEVSNDTGHNIKFSWELDGTEHGGKVTVDGESSETFHVETDTGGTVSLYYDGDQVGSVDIE